MASGLDSRFAFGACFANLGREILGTEIFAKHGRHAAFRLRRGVARAKSSRYSALDSCVCGAAGANALSTDKKGQKKNSREFPLVFTIKTTPEGGINLSIYFLFCFSSFVAGGLASQLITLLPQVGS